jgi:hypothetical protein
MTIGANAMLAADRFNNPQSALYLNSGYCTVPPGVYFSGGPFTITAWVKKITTTNQNRLLDFGNGHLDSVLFAISYYTSSQPYLVISRGSNWTGNMVSNSFLALNVWTHLTSVFDGSYAYIYLNGTQVLNQSTINIYPPNVSRSNCYIGRSNWYPGDKDANAYFDDIKIYNRSLSNEEIIQDMN